MGALHVPSSVRDVDASHVWDEQQQPAANNSNAAVNNSSFNLSSSAVNSSSLSSSGAVHRPSARELALQEAVAGWAAGQRKHGGAGSESLAAFVARTCPDELGCWALVAAQQQRGLAASSAHLERQMRVIVLAASGAAALGGSQALAPACAHFLASRGGGRSASKEKEKE